MLFVLLRSLFAQLAREAPGIRIHVAPTYSDHLGQLRTGRVDRWLRRNLGDSGLAARVEECVHRRTAEALSDESRAQAMLVMRAVAVLDPLAPLVWRGATLFPDGFGPLLAWVLASANGPLAVALEELVAQDGITQWCACQTRRR